MSNQTVKATSPLGDPRVTYNLEEGQVPETNMPVRFYIKPNRADGSASILVAENLDYETTRFFTLRVRVQNVAAVPLASFTTVYVNVTGKCVDGCKINMQSTKQMDHKAGNKDKKRNQPVLPQMICQKLTA